MGRSLDHLTCSRKLLESLSARVLQRNRTNRRYLSIHFKELVHVIVGAVKSEIGRAGSKSRKNFYVIVLRENVCLLWETTVFVRKAFN